MNACCYWSSASCLCSWQTSRSSEHEGSVTFRTNKQNRWVIQNSAGGFYKVSLIYQMICDMNREKFWIFWCAGVNWAWSVDHLSPDQVQIYWSLWKEKQAVLSEDKHQLHHDSGWQDDGRRLFLAPVDLINKWILSVCVKTCICKCDMKNLFYPPLMVRTLKQNRCSCYFQSSF